MSYDIVIVGAGLFGSTCAHELSRKGFRCLVIEKRNHVGGNCHTERVDGITLHKYGPHIFHTSNRSIWDWINQFAQFNHYRHHVKVNFNGKIYSFPPNLSTFYALWGIKTPKEAKEYIDRMKVNTANSQNVEGWIVSQYGRQLYEIFVRGYTKKQWSREPSELPASLLKRIPVRFSYDDAYFTDRYEGIPLGGYTPIVQQLLSAADVRLCTDYFEDRKTFDAMGRRIIYTGPLDRFFECRFGSLEYRGCRFIEELLEMQDFQGVAQMNYTSEKVPYTRIIEHKHFEFRRQNVTWISREYPARATDGFEMYPVLTEDNVKMRDRYNDMARLPACRKVYFGGRLAEYQYYDMHQVIGAALACSRRVEADLRAELSRTSFMPGNGLPSASVYGVG
jgi:UDP-galactopyranose mutase